MALAYRFNAIMLVLIAVIIALAVVLLAGRKGRNPFKKQGIAWCLTLLMVFAAIGIGYAKAPFNAPAPDYPSAPPTATVLPARDTSFVWDEAGVLSSQTVRTLDDRNQWLDEQYGVVIGVVTCNYGRDDLGDYAMKLAEEMGLGGYDMIVALDISGDNYWLIQGDKLARDFTDQDCSDYAYDYMEEWFAAGDYDFAVCQLTEMLGAWYGTYYG